MSVLLVLAAELTTTMLMTTGNISKHLSLLRQQTIAVSAPATLLHGKSRWMDLAARKGRLQAHPPTPGRRRGMATFRRY